MKNQTFGIEIEFTGITRLTASQIVAKALNTTDISAPDFTCYETRKITALDGRNWKVMRDGSINPSEFDDQKRCEMVSPICTYEDIETVQEIVRALRQAGAKVNESCGLHVHVGADGHTARSMINLTHIMANIEPLLFKSLKVRQAGIDHWCKAVDTNLLNKLNYRTCQTIDQICSIWYDGETYRSTRHYDDSRYHALNLHSVWQKASNGHLGTVEFRLFNSTLHAGEVKCFIQLAMAISHMAKTVKRVKLGVREGSNNDDMHLMGRWISLLGLSGEEFKTARIHLRKGLKANRRVA